MKLNKKYYFEVNGIKYSFARIKNDYVVIILGNFHDIREIINNNADVVVRYSVKNKTIDWASVTPNDRIIPAEVKKYLDSYMKFLIFS